MKQEDAILIEILSRAYNGFINRRNQHYDSIIKAGDTAIYQKFYTNKLLKSDYLKLGNKPDVLILTNKAIDFLEKISGELKIKEGE